MSRVVGIDLGTGKTTAAVVKDGKPVLVANAEGSYTTPAVIAVMPGGQFLVGARAQRQSILQPHATISSIKRFLGRSYEDVAPEETERVPYRVERGPHNSVGMRVHERLYVPEQLVALLLRQLLDDAARVLGQPVHEAVIAVPASFTHAQRQAVWDAATLAGWHVRQLINEPTATALGYTLKTQQSATVMVVDVGSETCEVSLAEIGGGVCEVRASVGDLRLGGDNFDHCLVDSVSEVVLRQYGINLQADRQALHRLREAAERARCELSSVMQTTLQLPHLVVGAHRPFHLNVPLSRTQFAALAAPLAQRCAALIEQALCDAKMNSKDVDTVLLVGGATRMPLVRDLVKKLMDGRAPTLWVHPDEGVATGAALQAGMLSGVVEGRLLFDVTPLALSVRNPTGDLTPVIERNAPLPCRVTKLFSPAERQLSTLHLAVLQGERGTSASVQQIAEVSIAGIQPTPQSTSHIEVTFDLDVNGLLAIQARDHETGTPLIVTISNLPNLSREEVDRRRNESRFRSALTVA